MESVTKMFIRARESVVRNTGGADDDGIRAHPGGHRGRGLRHLQGVGQQYRLARDRCRFCSDQCLNEQRAARGSLGRPFTPIRKDAR